MRHNHRSLFAHEFSGESAYKELQENLLSYSPKEILTDSECLQLNERLDVVRANLIPRLKCYNDGAFTVEKATEAIKEQYKTSFTEVFNLKTHKTALRASGALLSYLNETQKRYLSHLEPIKFIENSEFMSLNVNTRRSLELVSSGRENKRKGASYGCLTTQNWYGRQTFVRLGRASASKSEKDSKTA